MSRERAQRHIPQLSGALEHEKLLEHEATRALIRTAAANGKQSRLPIYHRKDQSKQAHPTGLTLAIRTDGIARLGMARSGPEGTFSSHHHGEAVNLNCGTCNAVLSRRMEQLIRAHLEAIAHSKQSMTLT